MIAPFHIEPKWREALKGEFEKPYFQHLTQFLKNEGEEKKRVFPPNHLIFNALNTTPFDQVRVVIVGQDPYHGPGQAHGLSFSVPQGVPPPPSLVNIFKEIAQDLNLPIPSHGCLDSWARQGVLLLNTTLTVEAKKPLSHHGKGWEPFTDAIVQALVSKKEPLVLLLWGKNAQEKCAFVPRGTHHLILQAPHPSPFSAHRGFLGCKHFSKTNAFLKSQGLSPIHWAL